MTPQAGDIAWAKVADTRGNTNLRPIVIINVDERVDAVAVTTSPADQDHPQYVPLPHHPTGNVSTRLRRPSWAACRWVLTLDPGDIVEIKGHVSAETLLHIREIATA